MPRNVAEASGVLDPTTGQSLDPGVISVCTAAGSANCTYWQYLQGTSMAAPHAAGVAALVVSQYGHPDGHGGKAMNPALVERVLKGTATDKACPTPLITYAAEGRDSTFDAPCVGTAARNSIYGDGVVDALAAVSIGHL